MRSLENFCFLTPFSFSPLPPPFKERLVNDVIIYLRKEVRRNECKVHKI